MRVPVVRLLACIVPASLPALLFSFSSGPPARRTGAAVDGGLDCAACHRTYAPANSDPAGSVKIEASEYVPGVRQTIKVTVSHPEGTRWGFQLTARYVSDPSKMAGSFSGTDLTQVRCDSGSLAPCKDGELQFAEHNAAGTRAGTPNGVTFEIDWQPPAEEGGAIVLYAAGNAANNNQANSGDRIYTTQLVIQPQNTCNTSGKPSIRTVSNSLSNDNRLSPNALFTVYGTNFVSQGVKRSAGLGDFVQGRFPTALACVAVEIGGQRAPISYVQPDQINAQVPTGVAGGGPVSVVVITNPGRPNETRSDIASGILVQNYAPSVVAIPGTKYVAGLVGSDYIGNPAVTAGTRAVRPGEIISLYGTGFGFTNPIWQAGEVPDAVANLPIGSVTVTLGGATLPASEVLYAGLAPTLISGAYVFNIRIPQTVGSGDVPIRLSIGGQSTQSDLNLRVAAP